jgi:hypothetical protein
MFSESHDKELKARVEHRTRLSGEVFRGAYLSGRKACAPGRQVNSHLPVQRSRTRRIIKRCLFITWVAILLLQQAGLRAQENINDNQLNLDFMLVHTLKNNFLYFGELGTRTLLEKDSKWFSFELNNDFHYHVVAPLDLIAGIHLNYTSQTDTTNICNNMELRPWLGALINVNPNAKIMVSNLLRYE